MKMNKEIPEALDQQVNKLIKDYKKKEEKKNFYKSVPYLTVISNKTIAKEYGDKPFENLDQVRYPAFCSYESYGAQRKGMITHRRDDGYVLWDCSKQWNANFMDSNDSLEELFDRWRFHIEKVKIIFEPHD